MHAYIWNPLPTPHTLSYNILLTENDGKKKKSTKETKNSQSMYTGYILPQQARQNHLTVAFLFW